MPLKHLLQTSRILIELSYEFTEKPSEWARFYLQGAGRDLFEVDFSDSTDK